MSHFSWETEVVDQMQGQPEPELDHQAQFEPVPEPRPELAKETLIELPQQPAPEPPADAGALAMSVDDFSALEDRILRAVNLVKRERLARSEAEERAMKAEARVAEQTPQIEHLQTEVNTLRSERDHVRQRVERLLSQLDALEL
jgi:FtsZ-binding cell division protein ZapB